MKTIQTKTVRAALLLATLLLAGPAFAQATRTWVSGVGDDVNPCSRTAPCKTFAGAISKTAAGGEISVLDPGSYGAVTITKAMTIDGRGQYAGILVGAGTNGITINAAASDIIVLRNLSLLGLPGSLTGIRYLNAAAVHLDKVTVTGFTRGIQYAPTSAAGAELLMLNTTVERCTTGVELKPAGFAGARLFGSVVSSRIANNGTGLRVESGAKLGVRDSTITGNTSSGVVVLAPTGTATGSVAIFDSVVSNNSGVASDAGLKTSGLNGRVIMARTTVTNNFVGVLPTSDSQIRSFGDNAVTGNGTDGNPTTPILTR